MNAPRYSFPKTQHAAGFILINTLVFAGIAIVVTSALVGWAGTLLKSSRQLALREQALQIAEAGIDYYRWHLAHNQTDYYDGKGATSTGPYLHDFFNKDGIKIGEYALTITPPPIGTTAVKIKSKGTVVADPTISRSIQVTLAIPSLAKYAVLANDYMRFGVGTVVNGPIQSNYGIHFDGTAHNLVTSAVASYTDPDFPSNGTQYGVYTTVGTDDPHPPTAVPSRTDVFVAGRQFPVPASDFSGLTINLSQIKSNAQTSGRYFAASGAQGYHIILKTNDTFDLYKVTALTSAPKRCDDDLNQSGWGTWSIKTEQFLQNYSFPENGLIFVEDHLWIDGQINTARITVAAARFPDSPSTRRSITINNDLKYTNYDGQDIVALIAQDDINAGLNSSDVYRVDAALVAQNGRIGRYYYSSNCGSNYIRDTITLFGMLATNQRYGFAYTNGTGYANRDITYDASLYSMPPPSFPLSSSQYSTISWDEVK